MNVEEAKILFNSHIREYLYPSMKNETMLIMVSKEKVIHIYSADDDYMFAPMGVRKVYVLEKNRDGKELDAFTSIRKYDAVDIARVINREGVTLSTHPKILYLRTWGRLTTTIVSILMK